MVYCSNDTTPRELAVEFSMNIVAVVNASLDNYYVYLNIPTISAENVAVLNDKVGMYQRDYNRLLSILLMAAVQDLNDQFVKPYDLRTINPDFMSLIVGTFTFPRISPFYQDNFLYMGLSYFFDPYTKATKQERAMSEQKIYETHGATINHIIDHVQTMVQDRKSKK